ncbi:hypothetical protein IMCC1933_18610 [Rhodobacteraceae bacterium IMCC1933]|nr:hypothetical protein [Rhodobacteraceae bacterium IMCC1923]MDP4068309.1 hypothetical protein [Rhodobacteraceae bacterium IMCC1933]MDP4071578.1 hypothetical protein [Rhodobacteraceae bacterium IMCC1909]
MGWRKPLDLQLNELGWPVLQVGIQGKDLVCGLVGILALSCSRPLATKQVTVSKLLTF